MKVQVEAGDGVREAAAGIAAALEHVGRELGVPDTEVLDEVRRMRRRRIRRLRPVIRLDLPEPPSIQDRENWYSQMKRIEKTKRGVWAMACQSQRPFEETPGRVRIHAHFRLWNRRDPWNLPHCLKPVIDALQQDLAASDEKAWRQGLWVDRGYLGEDADAEIGVLTQEIDRDDRGLTLWIEVLDPDWEDPR